MSTLRAQKGRDVSLIPALTDQLFLRDPPLPKGSYMPGA